jgi:hypothetical protein
MSGAHVELYRTERVRPNPTRAHAGPVCPKCCERRLDSLSALCRRVRSQEPACTESEGESESEERTHRRRHADTDADTQTRAQMQQTTYVVQQVQQTDWHAALWASQVLPTAERPQGAQCPHDSSSSPSQHIACRDGRTCSAATGPAHRTRIR